MKKAIVIGMFLSLVSSSSTGAWAREFLPDPKNPLKERYRPQFHYTTIKGWINDPIGLVVYRGEYHIFNDHNPFSCGFPGGKTGGEQSHWSHAISTDLVHWKHMPIAVYPDKNGACWSGSGVVDWKNSAGFQTGKEPPLVLAYTNAGATFGQSLAYSNDRGRTWRTYEGNPVLGQIAGSNRDPIVFWHEPTRKWVMALYVKRGSAHFFTSDDLKKWTPASEVRLAGFHECPDLFELPIDGDEWDTKWVLYDARFMYWLGRFNGTEFEAEAGPLRVEHGRNFYAPQTWDCGEFRRVQVGWMSKGKYPGMPFNQQMSFPCELTLRTGPKGVRLYRYPVAAIEKLHTERVEFADVTVAPGENPLAGVRGGLLDIRMEVEPGSAAECGLRLFGQSVTYARGRLSCLGASTNVAPIKGRLRLRILVDRASIEVFANDGETSLTSCFLPKELETGLELFAKGGDIRVRSLVVEKLRSAWEMGGGEPGAGSR